MNVIIIETNDKKEFEFIRELLKRTKIKNKELTRDDYEDFLLGLKMNIEKTGNHVPKSEIMKKLKEE